MYKLTYVESIDLLVCAINGPPIKSEVKEKIRSELKDKTEISKILVIEGSFEAVGNNKESTSILNP